MKKLMAVFVFLLVLTAAISAVVISANAYAEVTVGGLGLTIGGNDLQEGVDYFITNSPGSEAQNVLAINSDKEMTISGTSTGQARILVTSPNGANLIFSDLTIELYTGNPSAAFEVDKNVKAVNITLKGNNKLQAGKGRAGLENHGVPLVIKGGGKLEAYGYDGGAGIGGGLHGDGVDITISGGEIYAKTTSANTSDHSGAAGIGGGCGGDGKRIIISGGKVIAKNRVEYSSVYLDDDYDFANIEINTVTFDSDGYKVGNEYRPLVSANGDGAGIGGAVCDGKGGSVYDITICGSADVKANGGVNGAGIGGGKGGSCERIEINLNSDGNVYARSQSGAGIGGGNGGSGEKIDISGSGTITAYVNHEMRRFKTVFLTELDCSGSGAV